jgi:nitrate reductase alpha subunit
MIASLAGAGVRTVKLRGGMPLLGATRIYAQYRFANSLALLERRAHRPKPLPRAS